MDEVDLAALGLHFALLSLMAIGGVSSILPDMQRYVVEANHWLSGTQFADAYALGQAAPGPNMMFVTLLGWQLSGWAGAIVATLAIIFPPIALTLAITHLHANNPDAPLGRAIRGGPGTDCDRPDAIQRLDPGAILRSQLAHCPADAADSCADAAHSIQSGVADPGRRDCRNRRNTVT